MGDIRAPFGLVVAPGRVALIGAGETRETALDLLATYGLKPTSSTDPHLFEDVVHNWLMDLILGVADRPVPEGLPDLVGSDLRRR